MRAIFAMPTPVLSLIPCYIALGANLGDPVATVRAAIAALDRIDGAQRVAVSSLYRTAPVGLRDQPDFINAVARLDVDGTVLPAPTFLAALFAIEAKFGRVRAPGSIRNAPRTLDLDLLLYGNAQSTAPSMLLPHPRMVERAFVLAPLAEIAPALDIPGAGPVATLLDRVAGQHIERLD
jgi:2-amino-4-hydroxy-6-hydroxymethyldihydropteridine diphosphokinase